MTYLWRQNRFFFGLFVKLTLCDLRSRFTKKFHFHNYEIFHNLHNFAFWNHNKASYTPEPQQLSNFIKRSEDALNTCIRYMEKALPCRPPRRKISKYHHRFQSVLNDAIWHLKIGKCAKSDSKSRYVIIDDRLLRDREKDRFIEILGYHVGYDSE